MPGFTTHYIFGIKTYHGLNDSRIKRMISSNLFAYQLGLQGPDIFFYYLPSIFRNPCNGLASIMHEMKTGLFFENFIKEIGNTNEKERDIAYAYLSGFLCHYCLDTICHPYIYAKTNYSLDQNGSLMNQTVPVYYANHRSFETLIDSLILDRYQHRKPSCFNKEKTILLDKFTSTIISTLLCRCINRTYYYQSTGMSKHSNRFPFLKGHVNNWVTPTFIRKVINSVRIESKILSNLSGNKKYVIEYFENRFVKYNILSSLISHDDYEDKIDALNLNNGIWFSPWEPRNSRNDSFIHLFQMAAKKCTSILDLIDAFIQKIKSNQNKSSKRYTDIIHIMNAIGNLSYHSGLTI